MQIHNTIRGTVPPKWYMKLRLRIFGIQWRIKAKIEDWKFRRWKYR